MEIPEIIYDVSKTSFSPVRLFGEVRINGSVYHYDPENDTLERLDTLKKRILDQKEAAKIEREKYKYLQTFLLNFSAEE